MNIKKHPKESKARPFYKNVLNTLNKNQIDFLVGGAFAFREYTGIFRDTKDLDIFVKPEDCERVLKTFSKEGYRTELLFSHWIGKIYSGKYLTDVIFNSGNGLSPVDEEWFHHAPEAIVLGIKVKLCPPEEIIWQKAFIMERNRYDGADVAHIFHFCHKLNWDRLIQRFGQHWRVLLSHLILYGYIYPDSKDDISQEVMLMLTNKLLEEIQLNPAADGYCWGTFLSLLEYLQDVKGNGYRDARLKPLGNMSERQIKEWTDAFLKN